MSQQILAENIDMSRKAKKNMRKFNFGSKSRFLARKLVVTPSCIGKHSFRRLPCYLKASWVEADVQLEWMCMPQTRIDLFSFHF